MAYKALYRTYRPNSFDEVYGQKHIVQTLKHAVEQNKIAHAYLFCGPRGTGKTSIAKIFAKTINCTDEHTKACGKCENCIAVQEGNHPDIIEIDAASNNGVEEVSTLIEKVKYAPLKGKYKVYIIDEVHMMSTGAFNALLKTIEEPPEHVIFILATTEPHKVLPTIISRCQRFDFTKIPRNDIENRLRDVLQGEQLTCEDEVIRIIAQLADGGLRDALSILDQCIAYAQNDIKVHHINEIYGITTITEKLEIIDAIIDKEAVNLLNIVDTLIEKGIDIKRLTVDLIEILKESIIFEYTKDIGLLRILNGEEVNHMIERLSRKKRFDMIHLLMETYDKYRGAANVGSYFEVCLLQMLDDDVIQKNESVQVLPVKSESKQAIIKQDLNKNVSRETFEPKKEKKILEIPEDDEPYDLDVSITEDNQELELHTQVISSVDVPNTSKTIKPLDDDFILGLLAGANKPEKAQDIKDFYRIAEYMLDLTWAKSANLLKNSMIVGSGSNYIVISVDNQAEANEINEADSKNEFNAFIQELLHKNKKIFAISKEHQTRIIREFKERMINGTLPEPIQIETVKIERKEIVEKTQEETILDLFGEENIIITEE